MDLSAAARDIHELVESFALENGMSLHHLKQLWKDRVFSFIHEACPKDTTQAFFMQSLYSSALGHLKNVDSSLSWRLGGLFVLYCLYETQYVEPYYLIYLSLEDLEKLHALVKELRRIEHAEALKVVRTILRKEAFLFGCVSVDQKSIADACEKLTNQAAARLKNARFRLLANVPLQEHIYGNLAQDLLLDGVMGIVQDYAAAKQEVFSGLGVLQTEGEEAAGVGVTLASELHEVEENWESRKKELLSVDKLGFRPAKLPPARTRKRKSSQEQIDLRTEDDVLADEILRLIDME